MQKFIRSQQPVTLPPAQDNPVREIQEAKKRLILDGFGIWKELATTPRDGLQYPHEVRSEWNEFCSTPTSSSTSSMRLQFLRSTNGSNRCIHRR